ncbi:MAG: copper amine oxidase N-terminal domain-containing protein, partial [Ruminococcaceae bacterium]|nr:copper amine oxidase N-terminal domain-containing protein [Oscillospiraceae bacterium]
MKKFLSLLMTALLVLGMFAISATAADTVAYVDYTNGDDTNDGLTAATAKKSIDNNNKGAMYYTKEAGGCIVASGKLFFGNDYTMKSRRGGEFVITGAYGGMDYKNPTPASNPTSGVMKMAKGKNLTIETDTTLTDIILFHEFDANPSTIYVKDGATLTVTDSVVCMSKGSVYYTIVVEKGGVANLEGGTFAAIKGDGEKNISKNVIINSATVTVEALGYGFIDYTAGSDGNDGASAKTAKKLFGTTAGNGVMSNVAKGGTVIVSGKAYIGADYTIADVGAPITFTSYYNNVDYKNATPATNPACALKLARDKVLTIDNDVIFDNIILFEEYDTNEIVIKSGRTVTFTDTVEFMSKSDTHWTVNVESGATIVLSANAKDALNVSGAGTVKDYAASTPTVEKTTVKLTIGSKTAYINGKAETLDAAPINRNNRTMLPVRFLANAFGVSNDGIKWDAATRTATLTNKDVTIVVTIDKPNMTVNGKTVALDSPAIIENN